MREDQFELFEHGSDPLRAVKFDIVIHREFHTAGDFRRRQHQIEFGAGGACHDLVDLAASQRKLALGQVGDIEENIEQRIAAGCARRIDLFDQFFKRQLLIAVRVQANFANSAQQANESSDCRQVGAEAAGR